MSEGSSPELYPPKISDIQHGDLPVISSRLLCSWELQRLVSKSCHFVSARSMITGVFTQTSQTVLNLVGITGHNEHV